MIKTTDGLVYTNTTVIDISPTGIVLALDAAITNIAYSKLPPNLRARYGYDAKELHRYLQQGPDGQYGPREDPHPFAGEMIVLKKNRFTYYKFSDVVIPGIEQPILTGKFTTVGNWLVLHNPEVACTNRVMAIVNGQLALLRPNQYWLWKDSGRLDVHDALYRQKLR